METKMTDRSTAAGRTVPAAVKHLGRRFAGLSTLAALAVLAGCLEPNTSPGVVQGEKTTLAGSTWIINDPNAVGGKALKLSPRQGARVNYYPGSVAAQSIALRLRTDGCPADSSIKYTVNFKSNVTGSALVQIGPVRTLDSWGLEGTTPPASADSPWATVTLREGVAVLHQTDANQPGGQIDIRQLAHPAGSTLPSTCGLAVDLAALRATGSPGFANTTGVGKPRMFLRTNGDTDPWMDNTANSAWNASHYHRAEVHRPHADQYLPWYSGGLVYFKSHAVNSDVTIPNPAWILKSANGTQARINWSDGWSCVYCQPALDIGNPDVRAFLLARAKAAVAGPNGKSFKGLWVDDVNMSLYLVSSTGAQIAPIDPRTGVAMTNANWQRYMAEWMEILRAGVPAAAEIYHNSKYYVDAWGDPAYTTRQVKAATGIHLEGGFTDGGLGNDPWVDSPFSVAALARYIKKIHDLGKVVIVDNYADNDALRDYGLAAYHIFSADKDMISNVTGHSPADWWPGYDTDMGAATTAIPAAASSSGLWRRDFANGIVLLVQPTGLEQTITLPRQMVDTNGSVLTQITLKPKQAAVLTNLPSGGVGLAGFNVTPTAFSF